MKEFVHGDLGRTVPSVCSLLKCQVDYITFNSHPFFDFLICFCDEVCFYLQSTRMLNLL